MFANLFRVVCGTNSPAATLAEKCVTMCFLGYVKFKKSQGCSAGVAISPAGTEIGENKSEMRRKNMLWLNLPGPNPFSLSVLNVMMIRNPKLNCFNPVEISLLNLTVSKFRSKKRRGFLF